MSLSVTVVGTGTIGMTLAKLWQGAGFQVTLASRENQERVLDGIPVRPIADALPGSDAVLTAIPGSAVQVFLDQHASQLDGVPLIDASNNVGAPAMHHAAQAGDLAYYRAFNTLGVENFAEPVFDGIAADLFYSGPPEHKDVVEALIAAVGLRPVWVGEGADAADLLDGVARLWFTLALAQGRGRHLAFRMLP
ncbi:MAG: NAD(P)-binding domain-containing protein [Candidatus Nanopelagicales bacterium]|nr:NAD(P)-binding domain-containing protein [Candidatus Nanopelagicales bacterium]